MTQRYDPFEDSCVDCISYQRNRRECFLKGYKFTSEETMRETAKHCWAFRSTNWKATDPDLFITQQTKAKP